MAREPERNRIKARIATAREKADVAKASGLEWHIEFEGEEIDTTALAFMDQVAAERWIKQCARRVEHRLQLPREKRNALVHALRTFWRGSLQ